VNHFPPNPLPPVEPSKQLKSSTNLLETPIADRSPRGEPEDPARAGERSAKKVRRGSVVQEPEGQTATPPPSAHKGARKLAPKLNTHAMQNDQGFGQPDFMAHGSQSGMGGFDIPSDMFSYPLSAPATAQAFGNQRSFWDPDMGGMDIDFSTNGNNVPQTPNSANQQMIPPDWAGAAQLMHQAGGIHDQNGAVSKGEYSMDSQASMQALGTSAGGQAMFVTSFSGPVDDVFGIMPVNSGGAVNPGLIFSRPPSSSMDMSFTTSMQGPGVVAPSQQEGQAGKRPLATKAPTRNELRRSASEREIAPRRTTASSPIKPSGRPGLSRSFSENRGKKPLNRPSLPTLAPAPRPQAQMLNNSGIGVSRPVISQPNRPSGRSSPLKNQHHQRLPSLSSIPETGPRTRTQAKFTIDANGRARVETTVIVDDEPPPTIRKRHSAQPLTRSREWNSSEEDESSSSDDEPIIIPSRNTSFALPDPRKPTTSHPFHNPQRSVSDRSTTSYTTFRGPLDDGDSDTETVINDLTPMARASGDAASELRKLRESRRGQMSTVKPRRFTAPQDGPGMAGFAYNSHNPVSPTTLTDNSLPTPSTDSRRRRIRCVCNRNEAHRGDGFLIQW